MTTDVRARDQTASSTEPQRPTIVVGYADDAAGPAVLAAAGAEAVLRRASVTVIHKLVGTDAPERYGESDRSSQVESAAVVRIKRAAAGLIPEVEEVRVQLVAGSVAAELVASSRGSELLVLEMTSGSPIAAAAFGTVPHEVVRRSSCPTMTVPAVAFGRPVSQVVCGVDRSDASIAALQWSAHDAELRGVPLVVVEVRPEHHRGPSTAHVDLVLEVWVRRHLPSSDAIVHEVDARRPADHLLDVAADLGALLVVGAQRRRFDPRSGSVARVLTSQMRVPVVSVPADVDII